ncbi:hypothetical protein BJ546DRAFT_599195 [Cryomyces antarcticus]
MRFYPGRANGSSSETLLSIWVLPYAQSPHLEEDSPVGFTQLATTPRVRSAKLEQARISDARDHRNEISEVGTTAAATGNRNTTSVSEQPSRIYAKTYLQRRTNPNVPGDLPAWLLYPEQHHHRYWTVWASLDHREMGRFPLPRLRLAFLQSLAMINAPAASSVTLSKGFCATTQTRHMHTVSACKKRPADALDLCQV